MFSGVHAPTQRPVIESQDAPWSGSHGVSFCDFPSSAQSTEVPLTHDAIPGWQRPQPRFGAHCCPPQSVLERKPPLPSQTFDVLPSHTSAPCGQTSIPLLALVALVALEGEPPPVPDVTALLAPPEPVLAVSPPVPPLPLPLPPPVPDVTALLAPPLPLPLLAEVEKVTARWLVASQATITKPTQASGKRERMVSLHHSSRGRARLALRARGTFDECDRSQSSLVVRSPCSGSSVTRHARPRKRRRPALLEARPRAQAVVPRARPRRISEADSRSARAPRANRCVPRI